MQFNVVDYKAVTGEPVMIVSVSGYNAKTDIPVLEEGLARLVAESAEDIDSLGEPVLEALAAFKQAEPNAKAIWASFAPPAADATPKKKKAKKAKKELTPPAADATTSSIAGDTGEGNKENQTMGSKEKAAAAKAKVAAKKAADKEKAAAAKLKAKEAKAKAKEKAAAAKEKAKAKKSTAPKEPRGEKTMEIKRLLMRKNGCNRKEILEATGWVAVSVQAMAKACGLKLRQEKEKGKPIQYFGTPV